MLGTLTAVMFFASILADFALRHRGRIPGRQRSKERIATGIAVVFSLLTAVFCILLVRHAPLSSPNFQGCWVATEVSAKIAAALVWGHGAEAAP